MERECTMRLSLSPLTIHSLLQTQLGKYSGNYRYTVVDNEAGMEHLSRGLLPSVDVILLVSDCSRRGIQAVGRIARLAEELNLNPSLVGLIVNRAPEGVLDDGTMEEIRLQGLNLLGVVPQDRNIYEYDCAGKPLVQLPSTAPARAALEAILEKVIP